MGNKIRVKKDEMDKHPMSYLFKNISNKEREKIKFIEIEEVLPGAIVMSAEVEESESESHKPEKGIKSILIRTDESEKKG